MEGDLGILGATSREEVSPHSSLCNRSPEKCGMVRSLLGLRWKRGRSGPFRRMAGLEWKTPKAEGNGEVAGAEVATAFLSSWVR